MGMGETTSQSSTLHPNGYEYFWRGQFERRLANISAIESERVTEKTKCCAALQILREEGKQNIYLTNKERITVNNE